MSLAARFPVEVWPQAQLYFSSPNCGSSSDVSTVSITMETSDLAASRGSSTDVCGPALRSASSSASLERAAIAGDR